LLRGKLEIHALYPSFARIGLRIIILEGILYEKVYRMEANDEGIFRGASALAMSKILPPLEGGS
jgi:hypothetical protein